MNRKATLRSPSDIRRHFAGNDAPIWHLCQTNYYLLGIQDWVRDWRFVHVNDAYDGGPPHVLVPARAGDIEWTSLVDLNNQMLRLDEVRASIRAAGPGARAVLFDFDDETESLCRELGLDLIFPSSALRNSVGNKVTATRLAASVDVACVPNVLDHIADYATLRRLAGHLGDRLVIQAPHGDSGMTTWFVASEADWRHCAARVAREPEVKVMRHIRCRQSAIEACITRHGTIVGPLMTELIGPPELTPYRGGWAGNETSPLAFSPALHAEARRIAHRIAGALADRGYRGYFELDLLHDLDAGTLHLGEINARITGATALTGLAGAARGDLPLFLFHLLEFSDVDFSAVDLAAIDRRWADPVGLGDWSQLFFKWTSAGTHTVRHAPPTGTYRLAPTGDVALHATTHQPHPDMRPDEGFFHRLVTPNSQLKKGWDIGVLLARGRLMTDDYALTPRAHAWIRGLQALLITTPDEHATPDDLSPRTDRQSAATAMRLPA